MNVSYFRKSRFGLSETTENVIKNAKDSGWKILGEAPLPDGLGKMVLLCRTEWVKTLIEKDHNLLGFLPCAISVFMKENNVLIGTGQPAIIKALAKSEDIAGMAAEAEVQVKDLIHKSAGVAELKPAKVKLYSTMTCPYCKMEQSWLEEKKIPHDVVHVDLNQKEAEAMVAKTGQMGVPVTEIQYEGGESEYIIGFDKPRLEQILRV